MRQVSGRRRVFLSPRSFCSYCVPKCLISNDLLPPQSFPTSPLPSPPDFPTRDSSPYSRMASHPSSLPPDASSQSSSQSSSPSTHSSLDSRSHISDTPTSSHPPLAALVPSHCSRPPLNSHHRTTAQSSTAATRPRVSRATRR